MLENIPPVATEMRPESKRVRRRKTRLRTVGEIDGRSVGGKRARALAAMFEATLGGKLTDAQRLAISTASALTAIAEDASARRLQGDSTVTLDDLIRCVSAARRAVRDLGLDQRRKPSPAMSLLGLLRPRDG